MNKTEKINGREISRLGVPDNANLDKDMQDIVSMFGGDNWVRALTIAPKSARRFTDFIQSFFAEDGTSLSLRDRELVAVATSRENRCGYCLGHHTYNLGEVTGDRAKAYQFALAPRITPLSERDLAMVEFAEKLTRAPHEVQHEDIEELRAQGFTDQQILEITETIGFFNFANRMLMALGCPVDDRVLLR